MSKKKKKNLEDGLDLILDEEVEPELEPAEAELEPEPEPELAPAEPEPEQAFDHGIPSQTSTKFHHMLTEKGSRVSKYLKQQPKYG